MAEKTRAEPAPAGGSGAGGPKEAQQAAAGLVVAVFGPAGGRWRAGRKFGPEPVRIDLSEITQEEFAAIEADPELRIRRG
jgi:hypothetical protein